MNLILHAHPLSSYCWKVLIALYEKGAAFELRQVEFSDPQAAAGFRRLWPIGKIPVLEDDGLAVVESSVIIEHLDLRHPGPARLVPEDPRSALEVRKLDRVFDNYVMTPLQKIVGDRLRPGDARDPAGVADAHGLLETSYSWLEARSGAGPWAAGEAFTLADCAAGPALHYADRVHPLRERHPRLGAYLERLEERPSFARVLQEAAPYRHLFPE